MKTKHKSLDRHAHREKFKVVELEDKDLLATRKVKRTGKPASFEDVYRTKDGNAYFKFRFVKLPVGYYEIDIVDMPPYGIRSGAYSVTHRIPSKRGGHKICFGDSTINRTILIARKWAAMWAEHTYRYIKTGVSFPNN